MYSIQCIPRCSVCFYRHWKKNCYEKRFVIQKKKRIQFLKKKKKPESIIQTEIIGYYIDCTQILWSIDNIKYLPTYTMQSARKKSDCSQNQCDFKRVDSNDIFTITTCRFQSCLENINMHGLLNRIKLVYDPAILSHIHNSPGWTLSFHH